MILGFRDSGLRVCGFRDLEFAGWASGSLSGSQA